jgi:hypothetical protein
MPVSSLPPSASLISSPGSVDGSGRPVTRSTTPVGTSSLALVIDVSRSGALGHRRRELWVDILGVLFLRWCRLRTEGSGSSSPKALGRCSFRLATGLGPSANGSGRHVLRRLYHCRLATMCRVHVEVAADDDEHGVHGVQLSHQARAPPRVQHGSQSLIHLIKQERLSDEVQVEVGLDVAADVHGEVTKQGLLVHAVGGYLALPTPASSSACSIVVDPLLTQRRATDPVPTERTTAPAPTTGGPACPDPNLVVCSSVPSGCTAAAPGLASSEPVVTVLTPPSVEDAYPEPSEEDSLPTLEIRLHISINIVSHLNAVEEFRLLSGEELSLREFLLDKILLLQESVESCLVPHIIEELLGSKLVAPPRLRTLLVLMLRRTQWWRGVQWSFVTLALRQGAPRWWFMSLLGHRSSLHHLRCRRPGHAPCR